MKAKLLYIIAFPSFNFNFRIPLYFKFCFAILAVIDAMHVTKWNPGK